MPGRRSRPCAPKPVPARQKRVVPNNVLLTNPNHKPTGPTVGKEDAMGTIDSLLAGHVSFRCTSGDRIGTRGYVPGLQYEGGVVKFLL